MARKPDKVKTRRPGSTVPPEVALALRFGKQAYQRHPTWDTEEPDQTCLETYLLCGHIINEKDFGKRLWARFRGELLKRADIKTFWAFREYEKKRSKPV
jgi:hypothetical protein